MQGPSKKWQQPCVVEEERTSPQKGLKEDVVVVPPTHQIKITNGRLCVCERVPDGVLQVGFQTDVSNGLLFFLIQLAQGFLNAASLFWPTFFSFSPLCYLLLTKRMLDHLPVVISSWQ